VALRAGRAGAGPPARGRRHPGPARPALPWRPRAGALPPLCHLPRAAGCGGAGGTAGACSTF
jgi:hypothetical protein